MEPAAQLAERRRHRQGRHERRVPLRIAEARGRAGRHLEFVERAVELGEARRQHAAERHQRASVALADLPAGGDALDDGRERVHDLGEAGVAVLRPVPQGPQRLHRADPRGRELRGELAVHGAGVRLALGEPLAHRDQLCLECGAQARQLGSAVVAIAVAHGAASGDQHAQEQAVDGAQVAAHPAAVGHVLRERRRFE
jgi:hypothetical protein